MTGADALRELTRRRDCPVCYRAVNVRLAGSGPLVDERGHLRLVLVLHGPGTVGVFCEGSGEPVVRDQGREDVGEGVGAREGAGK